MVEHKTKQNSIRKEIKSKSNSRKTCYYSVQNLLPSSAIQKYKDQDKQNYNFVWV